MKNILHLSLLILFSCELLDQKEAKSELEKLPPITTSGENTFGCLVNGRAFVPRSSTKSGAILQRGFLQVYGNDQSLDTNISLVILSDSIVIGKKCYLTDTLDCYVQCNTKKDNQILWFNKEFTISGFVEIDYFDRQQYIVSGRFEFESQINSSESMEVTDGRFDLQYIP